VITLGYPPAVRVDGTRIRWADLRERLFMPEAFMNEDERLTPRVCVDRALELGARWATPLLVCYQVADRPRVYPATYAAWRGPVGWYTGDDVGAQGWRWWGRRRERLIPAHLSTPGH